MKKLTTTTILFALALSLFAQKAEISAQAIKEQNKEEKTKKLSKKEQMKAD